jgi:hypothetical protein
MTKKTVDDFDSANEVQSNWVKWNVPTEDKVMGTLTAKRTMKSSIPGREGELVNIYDLKADYGSFHVLDDNKVLVAEPVVVEPESMWSIGGTNVIDRQMINIKVGQKVGLKFTEQVPSKTKGFAPAKIIKLFTPKNEDGSFKMDTVWMEQNTAVDPLKDY